MKLFQYRTTQIINTNLDEAWKFFSNPQNLSKITPPWLNFIVTTDLSPKMYEGMIITYKVHPLFGVPLNWVTEIKNVKEKCFFVDEQRFGPYKFWHHQHLFVENNNGVKMDDIIHYAIPFDPLSRPLNEIVVNKKIKQIFLFREQVINKLFNSSTSN